ncbi:hypothetical protein [Diaminobutyricimonas sp. LJ205]|uniref:hypothetical protein n=1 Tax=Diaminobutyricimonas sp. LJ205 TaxID=2683590 RepID=UPI0012F4953B|nr:hypothetical protein [Diaminobutyricimonas sp. LJ205]
MVNRKELKTLALAAGLLAVGGIALAALSIAGIVIASVQGNGLWIGLGIAGAVVGVLLHLWGRRLGLRVVGGR